MSSSLNWSKRLMDFYVFFHFKASLDTLSLWCLWSILCSLDKGSAKISVTNSVPWDWKFYTSADSTMCCLFLNQAEIYFARCACSSFLLSLLVSVHMPSLYIPAFLSGNLRHTGCCQCAHPCWLIQGMVLKSARPCLTHCREGAHCQACSFHC